MHALPFALSLLMGSNCVQNQLEGKKPSETVDEGPLLVIWPDAVDFGQHRKGEGLAETIEIRNEGTEDLTLERVTLEGDEGFGLDASILDEVLAPGEVTTVTVTFTAQTLEHQARLVVLSDDPGATRAVVPLEGAGLLPALWVSPDPWDAGLVTPDCTVEETFELHNIGTDTLTIESVAQLGSAFELGELELPVDLQPGEFVETTIAFTPTDYQEYDSEIWIESNAPQHVAVQGGEGKDGGIYTQEWKQPVSGKSDIMFFVDQSCSMEDDKQRMTSNFGAFIEELEEVDVDYLVMVVTADQGCHNMTYIKPETADKVGLFQQAVDGNGGNFTEAGFVVANNALALTDIGECNSEFYRDNATVNVIFVSDEPEQSPPAMGGSSGMLTNILSHAPATFVSGVVGPVPDGCDTAEAGLGYYDAVLATGGLNLNICNEDWGSHLVDLAEQAMRVKLASKFYLDHGDIEPNSIVVEVDGVAVDEGWELVLVGDDEFRYIEFDAEHVPGEGANIVVTYANAVTCEQ